MVEKLPMLVEIKNNPQLFYCVELVVDGYGIIWNDDLDLPCNELWENIVAVEIHFDGLMRSAIQLPYGD